MKKIETKNNWRLMARNRRYLLYSIGLGLWGVGLLYFVLFPLVTQILDTNKQLQKETKTKTQLEQKITQLRGLQAGNLSTRQQLVNDVFPSQKPVLELLAGLNVVAGRSGVMFTDFQVSPGEIATEGAQVILPKNDRHKLGYDSIMVRLTAEGTFAQVQSFLQAIEQLAPLTTVSGMELNLQRKEAIKAVEATDKASADLTLETYFYTQTLTATLAAPLPTLTAQHETSLTQLESFIFPTVEQQEKIISGGLQDLFGVEEKLEIAN